MKRLDAVYFVRPMDPGSASSDRASAELRYSMRSLARNFRRVGRVFVLGGRPGWLNPDTVEWRPGGKPLASVHAGLLERWGSAKHLNTWAQWQAIAGMAVAGELSDRFVIMNDDFFVMHELDELPNEHRGSAAEWQAARSFGGHSQSAAAMERTVKLVELEFGVAPDDQLAYETHAPLTVASGSFGPVMRIAHRYYLGGGSRLCKRSLYGNAVRLAAERADDAKVHQHTDRPRAGARYLSSADESFRVASSPLGRLVRETFSTPCQYER